MTRNVMMARIGLILLSTLAPLVAVAQDLPPLQVDVRVPAKATGVGALFERQLEPGEAAVSGRVRNLPGGETALVTLRFDYKINADFALDEIISLIVISIEDSEGNEFSKVTIDPNTVNLNPNRVPLSYSATLYTPDQTGPRDSYTVHVQVFGNYE